MCVLVGTPARAYKRESLMGVRHRREHTSIRGMAHNVFPEKYRILYWDTMVFIARISLHSDSTTPEYMFYVVSGTWYTAEFACDTRLIIAVYVGR